MEENCAPAICNNCFGVTSNNTAFAAGNSSSERMYRPVSIFPPMERKYEAKALAIDCDPPFGTGQPFKCAATIKTKPIAEVTALVNGCMECAAIPAHRPFAFAVLN